MKTKIIYWDKSVHGDSELSIMKLSLEQNLNIINIIPTEYTTWEGNNSEGTWVSKAIIIGEEPEMPNLRKYIHEPIVKEPNYRLVQGQGDDIVVDFNKPEEYRKCNEGGDLI